MYSFRATITADKWPQEFTADASNWRAGIGKILSQWQKKNKGSRAFKVSIQATKIKVGDKSIQE